MLNIFKNRSWHVTQRQEQKSVFDLWSQRRKRQKDGWSPRLFCPGDTFPNLTCNVQHDEIPCAFEGQLCQNKTPVGALCWSSSQMLARKGGTSANSAASLYKQEKKIREMWVKLHWLNLITPRCQKGSGFGCVIPAPQLAGCGQGKEAVGRKPAKQNISDPQLLRARKTHVDVAKFSE